MHSERGAKQANAAEGSDDPEKARDDALPSRPSSEFLTLQRMMETGAAKVRWVAAATGVLGAVVALAIDRGWLC